MPRDDDVEKLRAAKALGVPLGHLWLTGAGDVVVSADVADRFVGEVEEAVADVAQRVGGFAQDMRDQGIHVGLGPKGVARCVTCGELWPCGASGAS